MAYSPTATPDDFARSSGLAGNVVDTRGTRTGAVSWSAVAAGAAAAASLSLMLLILGVGLGLSSVSPWAGDGVSATTLGVSTIVWLTLTQLVASAMGGYLAGRLRTKWTDLHTDEVYFRDTAHGFLAWAVSTLATAVLLASVIGSILSGGVQAGATMVGGVASTAGSAVAGAATRMAQGTDEGAISYFVDSLFRRNAAATTGTAGAAGTESTGSTGSTVSSGNADANGRISADDVAEIGRIFMRVGSSQPLPEEDLQYVGQMVAQHTGLSQQEAQARVTAVHTKAQEELGQAEVAAREATEAARKASAYSAMWLFVSLLVGAFIASLAATFGGRRRDA